MKAKRDPWLEVAVWALMALTFFWQGWQGLVVAIFWLIFGCVGLLHNFRYHVQHTSSRDRRGF